MLLQGLFLFSVLFCLVFIFLSLLSLSYLAPANSRAFRTGHFLSRVKSADLLPDKMYYLETIFFFIVNQVKITGKHLPHFLAKEQVFLKRALHTTVI